MASKPIENQFVYESVPMAHVLDVARSIEFYSLLGFHCESTYQLADGRPHWADMRTGTSRIFLSLASGPVDASVQAVLFYLYCRDVKALRDHLLASGCHSVDTLPGDKHNASANSPAHSPVESSPPVNCVFPLRHPFYMPAGELRIHDPDGYVLLVGQLD